MTVVATHEYPTGTRLTLWCPGCRSGHTIVVDAPNGWTWDGDRERPTISPSILAHGVRRADGTIYRPQCHSFVRAGRWEFLTDSEHDLAGQTVDVQPFPEDWTFPPSTVTS